MSYQNVALEQTHKEELVDDIGDLTTTGLEFPMMHIF